MGVPQNLHSLLSSLLGRGTHGETGSERITELASLFVPRHATKDTIIVAEGEVWNRVLFVERGMLRLFYSSPDGKMFNKAFFAEGELVWPMAPRARTAPSLFSIAVLEPCRLLCADFNRFHTLLTVAGLWETFALPYVEALANSKFLREYEFLVKDAEARFDAATAELGPLVERIPDYHLASYIGVTNVTLSRIRRRRKQTAV